MSAYMVGVCDYCMSPIYIQAFKANGNEYCSVVHAELDVKMQKHFEEMEREQQTLFEKKS